MHFAQMMGEQARFSFDNVVWVGAGDSGAYGKIGGNDGPYSLNHRIGFRGSLTSQTKVLITAEIKRLVPRYFQLEGVA